MHYRISLLKIPEPLLTIQFNRPPLSFKYFITYSSFSFVPTQSYPLPQFALCSLAQKFKTSPFQLPILHSFEQKPKSRDIKFLHLKYNRKIQENQNNCKMKRQLFIGPDIRQLHGVWFNIEDIFSKGQKGIENFRI